MTSAVPNTAWIDRPGIRNAIRENLGPLNSDATPDARKLLIVHGDRGSGRSALLDVVREELAGVVPVGAIDLADPRHQSVPDCLAALAGKLGAKVPGHGRMVFPRLLVGLAARTTREAVRDSGVNTRDAIRDRLKSIRRKSLGRVVLEQTVGGAKVTVPLGPLGTLADLALPIAPVGQALDLRLLRRHVNWYGESPSSQSQDGLDVLADLVRDGRDSRGRDMDGALCAAFVADLRHALGRPRERSVPAILIDNVDQPVGEEMLERFVQAHAHLPDPAPFPAAVVATSRHPRGGGYLVVEKELSPLDTEQCVRLLSWQDKSPRAVNREEARLVHEFSGGNAGIVVALLRACEGHSEGSATLHRLLGRNGLEDELLEMTLGWSGSQDHEPAALEICALARTSEHAEHLAAEEGVDVERVVSRFHGDRRPSWVRPLRYLLLRRLARSGGNDGRWSRYNESLASHCELTGDRVGAMYHALSAGRLATVADRLLDDLVADEPPEEWLSGLDEVVLAPDGDVEHWGESPCARYLRLEEEYAGRGTDQERREARRLVAALWSLSDLFGGPRRAAVEVHVADALRSLRAYVSRTGPLGERADEHRRRAVELRGRDDVVQRPPRGEALAKPVSRTGRRVFAVGVTFVLLVGLASGGLAARPYLACGGTESGLRLIEGECVGVGDGSYVFDPEFETIQGLIVAENARVADEADDETPVVRIALMTTLTPTGSSPLDTDRVRSALEGAYVAQVRANQEQDFYGSRPLVQLYLANEGSRQQHWREAVAGLAAMADDEIPLLMVVGPGLSSKNAEQAVQELAGHRIPMVSGIVTADGLDSSTAPGLLRASPRNSDYVASLRHYLDANDDLSSGIVLYDDTPDDIYTATLYEAYREQLAPYIDHHELNFTGRTMGATAPSAFGSAVTQICSQNDSLDMVFFAGREDDLEVFAATLSARGCVRDDPLTIVYAATGHPGDEKLLQDLVAGKLDLAMASSTHPGWGRGTVDAPRHFDRFADSFDDHVGGLPGNLDDGYAIMHHDATATAVHAVRLAADETPKGILPTPEEVRGQLFYLHGGISVPGSSGDLEFVGPRQGNPAGKPVPIILLGHSHGGKIEEAGIPDGEPFITDTSEIS